MASLSRTLISCFQRANEKPCSGVQGFFVRDYLTHVSD
jgi:hypothetical protein